MPKRIIICFDGTWNTPDKKASDGDESTNVWRFFESVAERDANDMAQIKWYDQGVGTKWYNKLRGGAFGVGLSDNIQQGYKFLAKVYEDGDEVYVNGFSRGAYSARSLVGLIRNSGLVAPDHIQRVPDAYQLYRTRDEGADGPNATFFRSKFAREVRIKFLGVWDTVGALGIPVQSFDWFNKRYYEFHDTELSSIVENAFHAVAVDEHRENYAATMWNPRVQPTQRLEQVWFAGAHANVGGGYKERELSDITLAWMQEKAASCGLAFNPALIPRVTAQHALGRVRNSFEEFLGGFYRLTHERYFRKIGKTEFGREGVHNSVLDRLAQVPNYRPKNAVGPSVTGARNPGSGRL
jgi:uncharacterized protein (DUF2235 family)